MQKGKTMTELLRECLADAESIRAIAKATGLDHAALLRFMRGTSLRLDKADILAQHFGLTVSKQKKRKT